MALDPGPPYDELMRAAETVARDRPDADPELVREVFHEAAVLLRDGLALDGLDEHDAAAVVAGLGSDLVAPDPGAAIRARARATAEGDLHDPESVARSLLIAAGLFGL